VVRPGKEPSPEKPGSRGKGEKQDHEQMRRPERGLDLFFMSVHVLDEVDAESTRTRAARKQ
jgi:hypothetical protein